MRWMFMHHQMLPYVDKEALRDHGVPEKMSYGWGPFSDVPEELWERLRSLLGIDTSTKSFMRWANYWYPRGHPINTIMIGGYPMPQIGELIKRLGRLQQQQRAKMRFNELEQEEPLPDDGLPDAWLPCLNRDEPIEQQLNIYTDPNSNTEDGKMARALLQFVHELKTNSHHAAAKLKLELMRRQYGLGLNNERNWDHFRSEQRRINSSSDEIFAREAYHAVWKDVAGKDN